MEENMSDDAGNPGGLAGLQLSAPDLQALACQGFVAAEFRQGRGPYYKLRWRQGGQQRTRYLGCDPARIAQVRAALEVLQRPHLLARQAARLLGEARQRLHKVKLLLAPHAESCGLRYHGYTLRRTQPPGGQTDGDGDVPRS